MELQTQTLAMPTPPQKLALLLDNRPVMFLVDLRHLVSLVVRPTVQARLIHLVGTAIHVLEAQVTGVVSHRRMRILVQAQVHMLIHHLQVMSP